MTIRQLLFKHLSDSGMFPEQAECVIQMAMRPEAEGGLVQTPKRIDHDLSEYPEVFAGVLILGIDRLAIEWIDANIPQAWYRPMFEHPSMETV